MSCPSDFPLHMHSKKSGCSEKLFYCPSGSYVTVLDTNII